MQSLQAVSKGKPAPRAAAAGWASGVDVASWQHPGGAAIDWDQVAQAGYRFAFIKATQGTYYVNPFFSGDFAAAANARIFRAAYHFADPTVSDGQTQADYLLAAAPSAGAAGALPVALDLENVSGQPFCYGLGPAGMVSWVAGFSNEIQARTGRLPAIYTRMSWWNPCTANSSAFNANPLWVASWGGSSPTMPAGWGTWAFWQWTSTGSVPGISGNVDVSYFNGDSDRLAAYAGCGGIGPTNAAASVASSQSSTEFQVTVTASQLCPVTGFDVMQLDTSSGFDQSAWNSIAANQAPTSVSGQTYSASITAEGFPSDSYTFRVRTHQGGGTNVWSTSSSTTAVANGATNPHPFTGIYVLDGYGGVHGALSPPLGGSAYWPGWQIARSAKARPNSGEQSGLVLDGFGRLHPYGRDADTTTTQITAFWSWDIARDLEYVPGGNSGYVLDGWGGLHPFGVNGVAPPPAVQPVQWQNYWLGWDIAKKVVILPDGTGGYILDGYGGLHSFAIGSNPAPPAVPAIPGQTYWANWDIARSVALLPDSTNAAVGGYILDGYGGLHPFGAGGHAAPPAIPMQQGSTYWAGWDIARGVVLLAGTSSTATTGYLLDGLGGLHPFAGGSGTPPPAMPFLDMVTYWPGWDIVRSVFGG